MVPVEERNYKKWLLNSSCTISQEKAQKLFKAVEKVREVKPFSCKKVVENSEHVYLIHEEENPAILRLNEDSKGSMLEYMSSHYVLEKKIGKTKSKPIENKQALDGIQTYWQEEIDNEFDQDFTAVQKRKHIPKYLKIISSVKPYKHALNFSFLGILVLQLNILPPYVGGFEIGDITEIVLLLLQVGICYLAVWTYSVQYQKLEKYTSILKITMTCCMLVLFWAANEILLISSFTDEEKMSVLAWIAITGLFSIAGIFLGVIITAGIYIAQGGQIVQVKKQDSLSEVHDRKEIQYPSIVKRVLAVLIDSTLITFFVVTSLTLGAAKLLGENLMFWIILFAIILYEPVFASFGGGTIGHHLLGLRIKKNSNPNDNISIFAAFGRYITKTTLGLISLLTIGSNSAKRGIHDKISGSVVILK